MVVSHFPVFDCRLNPAQKVGNRRICYLVGSFIVLVESFIVLVESFIVLNSLDLSAEVLKTQAAPYLVQSPSVCP